MCTEYVVSPEAKGSTGNLYQQWQPFIRSADNAGIRMVGPVRTEVTEFIRMVCVVPSVRPKTDQAESAVRFG
jgi:hypothetical protein